MHYFFPNATLLDCILKSCKKKYSEEAMNQKLPGSKVHCLNCIAGHTIVSISPASSFGPFQKCFLIDPERMHKCKWTTQLSFRNSLFAVQKAMIMSLEVWIRLNNAFFKKNCHIEGILDEFPFT